MADGSTASNRQPGRERAFRLLALTIAALLLAFAALGAAFVWYDRAAGHLAHAHRVRGEIEGIRQALTEAESAHRAFALTGVDAFSTQMEKARTTAEQRFERLSALTADTPAQHERLARLRRLMDVHLQQMRRTVAAREAGATPAEIRNAITAENTTAMRGLRRISAELEVEEQAMERQRVRQVRAGRIIMLTILPAFAVLLAFVFFRALRDINLDREAEARSAESLRSLLADRDLLLAEVNHRVKNSLAQIAGVVRLQARNAERPAREALERTLDRILAVGRVHEQLYQPEATVGRFNAACYAENLARDLISSLGREDVELETRVEAVSLDVRQAVPLALILNELITNALKHGCPSHRPCRIVVGLGTEGDFLRLTVSDEGDGLPANFSTGERSGMGLRVIEVLARQLGGRVEIGRPRTGASFAVVFPWSV